MSPSYVFVLGRTPILASSEIRYLFPQATITELTDHALQVDNLDIDPQKIIQDLGGTVTITTILSEIPEFSADILSQEIAKHAATSSRTFSLSSLGKEKVSDALLANVKKNLALQGITTRYVANKGEHTLSAIVLMRQHVEEYVIIPHNGVFLFTKTVAVQAIPAWVKREYDRPHADPKRGMLPPKVARMLVNIATECVKQEEKTLLDPFCGMGTVLFEGLLCGWKVVGSDIAPEVITEAQDNLQWLVEQYPVVKDKEFHCIVSDAVHISDQLQGKTVTAIITEPFLGPPSLARRENVQTEEIRNVVKGLEKMYIGCLKDWYTILSAKGIILMAFPEFSVNGREYFVKKVIDSCETLGYSIEDGPWDYSRPGATVKRKFYLLRKKE